MSYSSSCGGECTVARLLKRALDVLARESAWHHERLRALLSSLSIGVGIAGETLTIGADAARVTVAPVLELTAVAVYTELTTVLLLLEARATVLEMVRRGRLDLFGTPEALLRAGDGVELFLNGLVRCPSAPALLSELRAAVQANRGDSL